MNKIKTFDDFISERLRLSSSEDIILEGGAFGHLSHPFEDMDLSFADIKELIGLALETGFRKENLLSEKTDGIQLSITWKNGEIRFAKQVHTKKNQAETAYFLSDVKEQWKAVGDVMYSAGSDLGKALSALSPKYLEEVFGNGRRFLSLEVMSPKSVNTVVYGAPLLVFHGLIEYNDDGKQVNDMDSKIAAKLEGELKKVNVLKQKEFTLQAPNFIKLIKNDKFPVVAKKLNADIDKIMKDSIMNPKNTINDYLYARFIDRLSDLGYDGFDLDDPNLDLEMLVRRYVEKKGSYFTTAQMKKLNDKAFSDWLLKYSEKKGEWETDRKLFLAPIESVFLRIGSEVMKQMSSYLSADLDSSTAQMKKQLDDAISAINSSDNESAINTVATQLKRIEDAGGIDNLVSSEGIVFNWKGKLFKLTGLFAPVHQIVSIIKFGKL